MQKSLSCDDIAAIRIALLAFFDASARPLPWRSTRDPYAIWVSEVMAQQTRVGTIIPYYDSWLRRFPDVNALAEAPLDDVLGAWAGLGYYSRARNLHAAARVVRERHAGRVPRAYEELRALPGIGDYTAGAVASIAFGAPRAAVDGNVRRVLSRLLDHPAPGAALLRNVTEAMVPPDRPGDFNQALMELGATVCTPTSPRCGVCPVARQCAARASGTQRERPQRKRKARIPTIDIATAVLRDAAGRVLVTRRPEHGLLAGMWCFPGVEIGRAEEASARALALAHEYATPHGAPRMIGVVPHAFSHRRERYHCFLIDAAASVSSGEDGSAWIDESDRRHALPRAQQTIRATALGAGAPASR